MSAVCRNGRTEPRCRSDVECNQRDCSAWPRGAGRPTADDALMTPPPRQGPAVRAARHETLIASEGEAAAGEGEQEEEKRWAAGRGGDNKRSVRSQTTCQWSERALTLLCDGWGQCDDGCFTQVVSVRIQSHATCQ